MGWCIVSDLRTAAESQDFERNDQSEFRSILCEDSSRTSNTTCSDPLTGARTKMLSRAKYSKSVLFVQFGSPMVVLKELDPFIVHYNGAAHEKKEKRMKDHGLWFLDGQKNCVL